MSIRAHNERYDGRCSAISQFAALREDGRGRGNLMGWGATAAANGNHENDDSKTEWIKNSVEIRNQ